MKGEITLTTRQQGQVRKLKGTMTDENLAKKIGVGIGKLKWNMRLMGVTKKRTKENVTEAGNFCWEWAKKVEPLFFTSNW